MELLELLYHPTYHIIVVEVNYQHKYDRGFIATISDVRGDNLNQMYLKKKKTKSWVKYYLFVEAFI